MATSSLVWKLAGLLQDSGDLVLSGCSTLTLLTTTLQQLNHVFELHLGPWGPGQAGFVALPSHPADSPTILQLQFLFDVLQKTLSLKLVHVPGPGPQGPIRIFPFKSLKQLELRAVPLHCLCGLRGIYSQLETLICSRSLQALEELLSACGGDLCSALPWLALVCADFSYNSLTALDRSLHLLSALQILNLSHNQVTDCEDFLTALSELQHLDVSYNRLQSVPVMGPSGAVLRTVVLRGNELRSLCGLDQLRGLRHLDLAYNLLEQHRELMPLRVLAELQRLHLEGNPLSFHPDHRAATVQCLSPQARDTSAPGFLLDGEPLSPADLQPPTSSGLCSLALPLPSTGGSASETSYGPDLSDSPSSGGVLVRPLPRKAKNRIRVRQASISEPSDTDPEPRTPEPSPAGWFVQQQRELELMNSFRERFGNEWLQYRSHLETPGTPPLGTPKTSDFGTVPLDPPNPKSLSSSLQLGEGASSLDESLLIGPGEDKIEEEVAKEKEEVKEEVAAEEDAKEEKEGEIEDQEVEAELCRPMLVCPLEGTDGVRGEERFLRVTSGHLLEVELQAARTLERLDLQSLWAAELEMEAEPQTQSGAVPADSDHAPCGPIIALRFSYIRSDRRLRRYLVVEPDAPAAVQELLAVLAPAAAASRLRVGAAGGPSGGQLRCLRCHQISMVMTPQEELDAQDGPLLCPVCGSDHVVMLPQHDEAPRGEQKEGEQDPASSALPRAPLGSPDEGDGDNSSSPSLQALVPQDTDSWGLCPPSDHSGLRSVDHRLRLFLDVEIFEDVQEEFQCCLKVPVTLCGQSTEVLSLVVVSDLRLYVLEVTGEIRGQPSSWLQPRSAVSLQDLSCLELGLAEQSLRLEWAGGGGGCLLLPREPRCCRAFLEELSATLQLLPPGRRPRVTATKEEMTGQHRLWPLLDTDSSPEDPQFFYLRAFLVEGSTSCPVSLLITPSTLYLLDEDPMWSQAGPSPLETAGEASIMTLPSRLDPSVHIHEQQPLSSLNSIQVYQTALMDFRLALYDEVLRLESFWSLRVVCPEQLTALLDWIRGPWEELFSIGLRVLTREAPDTDP
ncbi:serine/threonine-protein kinase 11-interacting protein isoform X2 [Phascolarctos cinereus]|uniref:Serine/threonine-protein kinase 11-interacting protein n=1 Tax=Phascolarctos cinereus TaxID=38626 RepID=A0A6P5LM54_PHACI|nr:serine/threonine-protein kinase 11-interacting protein isoform X2 [Phascolarctos cinereus]